MPDACPHCQHVLSPDPSTGSPPARCPQCGGATEPPAARGPSLASFLRPDALAPSPDLAAAPSPNPSPESPAASPGPQAPPTTPDGALVHTSSLTPDPASASLADAPQMHAEGATAAVDTPADQVQAPHAMSDSHADDAAALEHPAPSAAANAAATSNEEEAAPDQAPAAPTFAQHPAKPRSRRVPVWQWAALALLAGALGIQMLIADRTRLAQDAHWRPVLERTCAVLRCSLPAWHQPRAYTMLARDVKPVPGAPGVLQVGASFRNDARWPQHWPSIAVSLSDADGRLAGARVLLPSDYLERGQLQATLAPGQSGHMTVQVREPPGGVVAFAFEFR